jgi:FKBP-type peptidyl-prolyl cis-trans isomerase
MKVLASSVIIVIVLVLGGVAIQSFSNSNKAQTNSSNSSSISISMSNSTSTQSSSGLIIEDIRLGDGQEVKSGQSATFNYLGTLSDGTKFDSSYDRGTPFTTKIGVGQVIAGWDEGIPGMKIGGKRKLTIPGNLAYGPRGIPQAGIGPNATLIFEVELISVQ